MSAKMATLKSSKNYNCPSLVKKCVNRIYTDLAVIDVTDNGLIVREIVDGLTFEQLQDMTGAQLTDNT